MTGIPLERLSKSEEEKLLNMRENLSKNVERMGYSHVAVSSFTAEELEEEVEEKGQKRILELVRLCLLFLERYQKEKEERAVLDFSDLEHFALKLLYKDGEDKVIIKLAKKDYRQADKAESKE